MDRVLTLHAGSRGFDSHRGHMSERFFRSNRPSDIRTQWALSWKIVVSEWRSVIAVSLNVGCGVRLIKPAKLCMCTQNTTNTTRTDTRRRVCAAMVPYRWATRGTSLRELEYTHTHTIATSLKQPVFSISKVHFYYKFDPSYQSPPYNSHFYAISHVAVVEILHCIGYGCWPSWCCCPLLHVG